MGITLFESALRPTYEDERNEAVLASGALKLQDRDYFSGQLDACRHELRGRMAALTIIHQDWAYIVAAIGLPEGVHTRRAAFCSHVIMAPAKLFFVGDAVNDDRFAENPYVTGDMALRFYAGASVQYEGMPVGSVCIFDSVPRDSLALVERLSLMNAAASVTHEIRKRARSFRA